MITNTNSETVIKADLGYSDSQFTFNSTGTGVMADVIASSGFYCDKLRENLTILPFIISIYDSDEKLSYKYTLDPVYVDSSSLLTFGAIDETYTRKTEIEDINSDHTNVMADITDLNINGVDLTSKSDVGHTHEISEVNDLHDPLDSKADLGHMHTMSDIAGVTEDGVDLTGVASKEHTHEISEILTGNTILTWNETNIPSIDSGYWMPVGYGNGKYVAVSYNSNSGAYSEDGITWTKIGMSSKSNWQSICYGDEKYVAIGYNSAVAAYSEDGKNWTDKTMPSNVDGWYSICYGDGKFVIINEDSDIVLYSTETKETIQTALDKKADTGHSHEISEINKHSDSVNYWLDTKSDIGHTHEISEVNGLQTEIESLQSTIEELTSRIAALESKA